MLTVSTQIANGDDMSLFTRMLESVSFADEILIYAMDQRGKALADLAKKYHAKLISVKTPRVVEVIRDDQVKDVKGDWVLIMDYDEVVTPALAKEIKQVTSGDSKFAAYTIRRKNFSLGYPISHGGFGDDYVHRLFKKDMFIDWPKEIHSTPQVKGEIAQLKNHMEHHKDASLAQMVEKTNRYSDIEAEQFYRGGMARVTPLILIRKPFMEFFRRYFLKKGFLDGRIGLIQSLYQGYSVFITYSKLYEKQKSANR